MGTTGQKQDSLCCWHSSVIRSKKTRCSESRCEDECYRWTESISTKVSWEEKTAWQCGYNVGMMDQGSRQGLIRSKTINCILVKLTLTRRSPRRRTARFLYHSVGLSLQAQVPKEKPRHFVWARHGPKLSEDPRGAVGRQILLIMFLEIGG